MKLFVWNLTPLLALGVLLAGTAARAADPKPEPVDPVVEAATTTAKLEELDAIVQKGLAELADATKGIDAERKTWASLDRSVASARAVNKAVGDRNKLVVKLYDTHVSGALAEFAVKLKAAPAVYRRMAVIRSGQAAGATLDFERRNYQAMADLCESAAVLCEKRYAEVFGGDATSAAGKPRSVTAYTLAETVANMRKLSVVHDRWEETFAAYPSALALSELATLFDHLDAYAEDVDAFTKGVEALNAVLKRKSGASPKPTLPAPVAPKTGAAEPTRASGDFSGGARKLTEADLQARVKEASRFVAAQALKEKGIHTAAAPVRVTVLPERLERFTVYVVSGPPPAACRVPANVVYDAEPAPQGLRPLRPLIVETPVTDGRPLGARAKP